MSIKEFGPSRDYKMGGYRITVQAWLGARRQQVVSFADYRDPNNGKIDKRKAKIDAEKVQSDLKSKLTSDRDSKQSAKPGSSLINRGIVTLKHIAESRVAAYGDASMGPYFRVIIRECGHVRPEHFADRHDLFISKLRAENIGNKDNPKFRSISTINRFESTFRMIFNFAVERKIISSVPCRIELEPEDGRDRIWSEDERKRLFDALGSRNSWLYWAVYFSQYNPIRAGDLFSLNKELNYDPMGNWVYFYASKTKRRDKIKKKGPTVLKQVDQNLRNYFSSLPVDCPYLFPRIDETGAWHKVTVKPGYKEYAWEWEKVLEDAKIEDFHFHDLKHCATTYLRNNGYSYRHFEECNISTAQMVKHYTFNDADNAPVIVGFEKPKLQLLANS